MIVLTERPMQPNSNRRAELNGMAHRVYHARMLPSRRLDFAVAALLLATASAPLAAQWADPTRAARPNPVQRSTGVIDGTVTDSSLRPIAFAEVAVLRTEVKLQTNSQGRFRFVDVPAGQYLLIVRRIGYRPISTIIQVGVRDTLRLSFTMERPVQSLDAVVVTEAPKSLRMQEFEQRRAQGWGFFLTEEQITKRNLPVAADYLRMAPSILLAPIHNASGIADLIAISKREGGSLTGDGAGACAIQIVLDGVPMPPRFPLELLPTPKEIAGIEVYSGPATVPAQFSGLDRRCGMVLVWTRDGR